MLAHAPPAQVDRVLHADTRIAGFRTSGTLGDAVAELGPPTRRSPRSAFCEVHWRGLGAPGLFASPTRPRPPARCGPDARFAGALVTGEGWRTGRGLELGDPARQIRELYPRAAMRGGGFWLIARTTPRGGAYAAFAAIASRGRVIAFSISTRRPQPVVGRQ